MPKTTKKSLRGHINNLILLILSAGFFWLGTSFLEYEIAKMKNELLIWIQTPIYLNLIVSSIMILGSIIVLAFIVLIYYKRLENHKWLWVVIFLQSISLILLSYFLGYNKFIWILFPQTFSIFK